MPADWDDLLLPLYRGRIGMALPSRSGTSHMMVERFLQVRGWQQGWDFYLRLSENLSTLTSRSFGVIDGLKSGRFSIGLSIDFLAGTEPELNFRYGRPVMIFPAQIGRLAGGMAPDLACDFITFVLSDEGQRLLLQPEIGRVPALAGVRDQAGAAVPDLMRQLGIDPRDTPARPVLQGGPVETGRGFVLHTPDWSGQDTRHVLMDGQDLALGRGRSGQGRNTLSQCSGHGDLLIRL